MTNYIHVLPVSAPLRAALAGGAWPSHVTAEDVEALDEHGLVPLAFERSRIAALRDLAMAAAVIEPIRLRDLRLLLDALHGIPLLILKGTALAYDVYDTPERRPRGDVDLLIRTDDLPRVRETFRALGYTERLTSGDELGLRQTAFSRVDDLSVEHVYDVHWEITNRSVFRGTLTVAELSDRAIALPRIAESARGLSHVDALLLACIHRVAHHRDSDRLIWLYDIHLLWDRLDAAQRGRFAALAEERSVLAICRRSVLLAQETFGGAIPTELPEAAADEPSAIYLDRSAPRGVLLAAELQALPGWRARLQRARQLALPPAAFMRQQYPRSGPAMLPLLYAWRALRGVARLFRGVA